jgi:phosphoglycerate dehydrogenase-like enzyme
VTSWVEQSKLVDVLPAVDALVLACPLTDETRLLIGAPQLAALKPGAVLVNVARGGVIDEEAMIHGLAAGRIKGAALDVFSVEPLPPESRIWDLPNVIFSPHSASTVAAENRRIVDMFLENLGNYMAGRPLRNRFHPEHGY